MTSIVRNRTQPARTSPTRAQLPQPPRERPPFDPVGSDFQLLEHRRHRDDVALELQLRFLQPGGDPTSCDRCRIGIWKSFPVAAFSFDCHASSERWQSGHGVTIAWAPASFACSIGWISSPSAVSSRAWMIGKPQHLILAG